GEGDADVPEHADVRRVQRDPDDGDLAVPLLDVDRRAGEVVDDDDPVHLVDDGAHALGQQVVPVPRRHHRRPEQPAHADTCACPSHAGWSTYQATMSTSASSSDRDGAHPAPASFAPSSAYLRSCPGRESWNDVSS